MSDTRKLHYSEPWPTMTAFCGRQVDEVVFTGDSESLDALGIDEARFCKTCQRVRGARERGRHECSAGN